MHKKTIFNRNSLIIFLIFVLVLTLTSCKENITISDPIALGYKDDIPYIISSDGATISLENYDEVKPYYGEYLMVKKGKKWGFFKNDGSKIIKPQFDEVYPMQENKAVVILNGETYIINDEGIIIYTFYNNITSNSYFQEDYLVIIKNNQYGYLKYEDGKFTIFGDFYDYAGNYNEGFACVGKLINETMKYSYLSSNQQLVNNDFIYLEADDFSCGFAKVARLKDEVKKYYYLQKPITNDLIQNPEYLKSSKKTISCDYGLKFENNYCFIAEYNNYDGGTEDDNTLYYKSYTIINNLGEVMYEDALKNFAKAMPKMFYPSHPLVINDVFCFFNAQASVPICNFVYLSKKNQPTSEGGITVVSEFLKSNYTIDENDNIIKEIMEKNNWALQLTKSYLTYPNEFKKPFYNETLQKYVFAGKIYGDRWSMLKINVNPINEEDKKTLDEYSFSLEYFISISYDYIIY